MRKKQRGKKLPVAMKRTKRCLWVVEMLINGRWERTVGAHLSRDDARADLREWRFSNPHDRFRLVRYIPDGATMRE